MSKGLHSGSIEEARTRLAETREEAERARAKLERVAETLRNLSALVHRINNPLTSLLGRAQLLKATAGTDPRTVKACTVIEESGNQLARLIRELGELVKQGKREVADDPGVSREDP